MDILTLIGVWLAAFAGGFVCFQIFCAIIDNLKRKGKIK